MRWLLPKSLNGFLLLGLGVLAGPLLLAILNATVQMRRLADTSQRLVADSVQTTRLSQDHVRADRAARALGARCTRCWAMPRCWRRFASTTSGSARSSARCDSQLRAADAPRRSCSA